MPSRTPRNIFFAPAETCGAFYWWRIKLFLFINTKGILLGSFTGFYQEPAGFVWGGYFCVPILGQLHSLAGLLLLLFLIIYQARSPGGGGGGGGGWMRTPPKVSQSESSRVQFWSVSDFVELCVTVYSCSVSLCNCESAPPTLSLSLSTPCVLKGS